MKEAMPDTTHKTSIEDFERIPATQAALTTSRGIITIDLYRDQTPITTANFVELASRGFYDEQVFHRVIENFMAQAGDPLSKDVSQQALWGTGGPGYTIADEFRDDLKHDSAGVVSMANRGPGTGGSQFFITFEATPWLDGQHTIFGKVMDGMDVLMNIQQGDVIESITLQ
ncbi:MAG: peptidylprolyl isomerase [Pseudomonadales bacterium]|nr:peptidylprolyl isomerase [Candidatus Woesebacteria bacterium]MCB9801753.1 peptidylprolyl isomerase [Pseudomonadales bacterium]